MEGLINYRNEGLLKEIALMPHVCNTVWGSDYFMMDCSNFMGKKSGEQYDIMIDMFIKIRLEKARRMIAEVPPEFWE
jgi:hypothetical protein